MGKKIIIGISGVGILGIVFYLAFWHSQKPAQIAKDVRPEVLYVDQFQATIVWNSENSCQGQVFYTPVGAETQPLSAQENMRASQHEATLVGLEPATRYTYWIEGSDSRFQFQTQPAATMPFSFLLVFGNIADQVLSLMMSEAPELIVSLTPIPLAGADPFQDARPYIPIFGPEGVDSPFLRELEPDAAAAAGSWLLTWGSLGLVFLRNINDLANIFQAPEVYTYGVITSAAVVAEFGTGNVIDPAQIQQSALHEMLLAHNAQQPTQLAAFVGVIGANDATIEVDGIQYVGIVTEQAAGAIRVDVDVEAVNATFLQDGREIALRTPPLKEKRTCEECRRLADQGAYEESVNAYMEFIANNQGHYQIEDAYYAIAEIFDAKLFRFDEALTWYRRLIQEYPDGTLTPLGKQRIQYLSTYADYNFEPLRRFEQLKTIELARATNRPEEHARLLQDAAAIVADYPQSASAPVILAWLANQYSQIQPDTAVEIYKQLKNTYPKHPESQEVLFKIGEVYYNAERYRDASAAYQQALTELPALAETIQAQIARCIRNLRRDKIAIGCWVGVLLFVAVTLILKPFGMNLRKLLWAGGGFLILAILLTFGAWLIHEQFASQKEMLQIVLSFSAIASLSAYLSILMIDKVSQSNLFKGGEQFQKIFAIAAGSLMGILVFLAGVYLTVYYIYVHYLIIVGL